MATTLEQRDIKARHPLCPACGYDLVATLAANKYVCPECGEPIERQELAWESRAGDWTLWRALWLAGRALAIRSALALVVSIAIVLLALLALHANLPRLALFALALAEAAALGAILSRKLHEHAGFESGLLILGACAGAVVAGSVGHLLAVRLLTMMLPTTTLTGGLGLLHDFIAIFGACVWIVHHLLLDD